MIELAIDIETYSETDIKSGVHKYCEDPNFTITLFAYCVDKGEVNIIDLANGEKLPSWILLALRDPKIVKTAYNAAFEITCLSKYIGVEHDPKQWSCTQALAAQAGLPFGLDNVATVLRSVQQKDSKGKELIKYFTMPCKPTKVNGMRSRNLPQHAFDKWLDFKDYCCQDVRTEQSIREKISWFTTSHFEMPVWNLDQKINNIGVRIDLQLVKNAVKMEEIVTAELKAEMTKLTGILNPKSNKQVKDHIAEITGEEIESLNKAAMPEVYKKFHGTDIVHVLNLRDKLNYSSVKKYTAMINSVCKDDRIRGLFMYYGANRTGRFAGRNVQLQNLTRNTINDLDFARRLVKENKLDVLKLTYDDVGMVLSNLIRTAFIPSKGNKLGVSDLSAIEARIVAWLAKEQWRLDVFATHGKIYEASASQMFKIPMDQVTKEVRTKGKISELALGYQGAAGALERMGAVKMGVCDEVIAKGKMTFAESGYADWEVYKQFLITTELNRITKLWRKANPKIVKLWYDVQDAAIEALSSTTKVKCASCMFEKRNGNLIITLPSGRELVYIGARLSYKAEHQVNITYYGMNQTTKVWGIQDTYGGKLVENITQAIARDVLVDAMLRIDKAGYDIIMHVHDEVVVDIPVDIPDELIIKKLDEFMSAPIDWAPGLPLGAESFVCNYYQK